VQAKTNAGTAATNLWKSASFNQKLAVGGFVLAGLVVIAILANVATRPSYVPLFAGLQQDDAAQIVGKLKEKKVEYRLASGGNAIEVPEADVYEMRLQMAEAGLPKGGHVGFELFDGNHMGLTEFGEHINYMRALQGELERTISELDSVESARVHLALPEEKLYLEEEKKPTASVVLKMRSGATLTPGQTRGIVHMVSAAVEGLPAENVRVLDTTGKLLSVPAEEGEDGAGDGLASMRLQTKREMEHEIEGKVQTMLDQVAGPGKAVVRVDATLDFNAKDIEEAVYQPAADGKGVLESQQETKETYKGSGSPIATGIPGVAANTAPKPANPAVNTGGNDSYERVDTNNKYQVSKKIEHSKVAPGQLTRLSMALFVDESIKSDALQSLQKAAAAAAGIDTQRGDQVIVESIPFATPKEEDSKQAGGGKARQLYFSVGKDVAAILVLAVFLFFVKSMLKTTSVASAQTNPEPQTSRASASDDEGSSSAANAILAQAGRAPTNGNVDTDKALENLDSERMAQAIRGLMSEADGA
jgi:flagellar M-ring protein FliF